MKIDAFHGFTLAILLLFVGNGLVARSSILRRYSIPESLVGGLACALVVFVLYLRDRGHGQFRSGSTRRASAVLFLPPLA
ncbi:sodium--glutamate symport carrier (gltS) [Thalassospira xiamenensis M-5 = DSM 17429]|uniref:sodium/glutamate symporter n=1 Tax=Thalassospira xiamenensis TaxID=220697 RepID=UPI000956A863|nr:sodium/glutamate symporter [Thalassospira xiamenensis]SIT19901.1 sodium--glutamate symport carrier (gltS) [Thalassospira xiamenensis M-5 = DSM 17429]